MSEAGSIEPCRDSAAIPAGRSGMTGSGVQSAMLQNLPHDIDERPHDEGYRHDCQHAFPPRFQQLRGPGTRDESAQRLPRLTVSLRANCGWRFLGIV
jgi:hypothetical protein